MSQAVLASAPATLASMAAPAARAIPATPATAPTPRGEAGTADGVRTSSGFFGHRLGQVPQLTTAGCSRTHVLVK